ncbi:hypothetical protein JS528_04430 [Bifidobacterium sp. MA2]|uniref:Uncharacterized protein n=1 Tax=Bifidobacterium santillanense TaxID=2809028 RepID=A0ABS5UNV1_9BIFI|nr:hypothetical protein [Bifidobacterium santillanense]MBT1172614.1 hypothetical protein [Bifidobacterium santillanense]
MMTIMRAKRAAIFLKIALPVREDRAQKPISQVLRTTRENRRKSSPETILPAANAPQHSDAATNSEKSYPHGYSQMWVTSVENWWITPAFIVDKQWVNWPRMWMPHFEREACG